jgi:SOS-response transcriptional repressor LexA
VKKARFDSKYAERRQALARFISEFAAAHGCCPSAAQVSRQMGWSKSSCQGYLRRLGAEQPLPAPCRRKRDRYALYLPQLLRLIQDYSAQNGFAPVTRELASETGLSPTSIRSYLRRMQQEGWIDFQPRTARSLRVIQSAQPGTLHHQRCRK